MKTRLLQSPFIFFAPILLFYILYTLANFSGDYIGDETGYLRLANNLLNGYYSPPPPAINLWWGPGYPMLIALMMALHIPVAGIVFLNPFFLYLSVVYVYKATRLLAPNKISIFLSLFWAFCYGVYYLMIQLLTECFTALLVSLLVYFAIKAFVENKFKHLIISALFLTYLALTKVIFGYVILVLLLGYGFLLVFKRHSKDAKKGFLIFAFAMIFSLPYLIYTYSLTGKIFYWGNSGGMSLYWMSTPFPNEYGSWKSEEAFLSAEFKLKHQVHPELIKNHKADFEEIAKYSFVARDEAYKRLAIANIKKDPLKYLKNIISNTSCMFFGFPNNYAYQVPLSKIWYFAIVFTMLICSILLTIYNYRSIPMVVLWLGWFSLIYLAGSVMLSSGNRQLIVILPVMMVWFAYIFNETIRIRQIDENH